ncbi:hypothetical protein I4U23_008559 [Adineta vaga]|nr:hypothetical protein I4U23_008559 [Adineta vaga]
MDEHIIRIKVIYTLNTKVDEHETFVSNLKQAFEHEKTALATNASSRIDDLLQRVEKLSSIKTTQNSLYENKIQMLESERQNQSNELLRIQQSTVEREHELSEDFRAKISTLKQEMNRIKKTYDDQLTKLKREHKETLDNLHEKHQLEIESFKKESKHLFDVENEAQAKFYSQTIEELKREHNDLLMKQRNQQMTQNELGQEYLKEKQQLEKRIQSFENQIEQIQSKFQLEFTEQKHQLEVKSNEYTQLQKDFEQYKSKYQVTSTNLSEFQEQLIKQKDEYENLKQKLDKTYGEMNTVKEKFNKQTNELDEKSKLLKEKECFNRQLENDLINCRKDLEITSDRFRQFEQDQHSQLTQSESTTNYLERRIHELDKTIHELTVEKQQIMVKYDRELTDLRETYENQVELCKKEMQNELNRLSEHHQQLITDEQTRSRTKLQAREQELHQQFELEKTNLLTQWKTEINLNKSEQNEINQELDQLKESYTKQIDQLKECLKENENKYSISQQELSETQLSNKEYKKQIEKLQADLEKQFKSTQQFQMECDHLKKHCKELEIHSTTELKEKIDKLAMELNEKWSKKLKTDCEKIRKEITLQKDEEKQKAIDELQQRKQNELLSAYDRIEKLEQQIQQIKNEILTEQQKSKEDALIALQNVNEDKRRTINEFQMRIQDLTTQLQRLESKNKEDSLEQKLQFEKEHLNQINELKNRHMEDIRGQQLAYNTHLDTIRADHERALALEVEKQNVQQQSNLDQLRKELNRIHSNELEEKERALGKELAAVRLQLDRSLEITKIKEREADLRIEDLTNDLTTKQNRIDKCLRDFHELESQIEQLHNEANLRNKELQRVRNETQKEMKHREEKLRNQHEEKIRDLIKAHEKEEKQLLEEFSKAHDLLKARISELQFSCNEVEERYRKRESRTEDLELISTLQQTIDEKKFLQMELVNRETNFNKVFTNAPSSNVGVLNPLAFNTKFVPRSSDGAVPSRLKSQSPRPSKLEPLVTNGEGPPDLTLKPNKPLLPKRFVK